MFHTEDKVFFFTHVSDCSQKHARRRRIDSISLYSLMPARPISEVGGDFHSALFTFTLRIRYLSGGRIAAVHLFLLGGSETEVVEHLRFEYTQCFQQSRNETGGVRFQTAACRFTDLHQGLDTSTHRQARLSRQIHGTKK